jgi:hypothetical protein
MSIRSIEIQYESGPRPLIWALKVEQEYNGYKATTVFGGDVRTVNGKRDKVCPLISVFARIGILVFNVHLSVDVYFQTYSCLYTYWKILLLQFFLEPYEFLTQVEGYYGFTHFQNRYGDFVQALTAVTFHTNLKKVHGPYGGGKEPYFTHFQSSVGKIVGFLGTTGYVVDQLRVFMSHDL